MKNLRVLCIAASAVTRSALTHHEDPSQCSIINCSTTAGDVVVVFLLEERCLSGLQVTCVQSMRENSAYRMTSTSTPDDSNPFLHAGLMQSS